MGLPPTIDEALIEARRRLRAASFSPTGREALLLLGHVLGLSEAQVVARDREALAAVDRDRFEALLTRRLAGEPMAYILGVKEFYGREFAVDRRVLIPRPETEHLVEAAVQLAPPMARIVDIGTGSGCIACTLALEIPDASLLATDRSIGALAVARTNLERHSVADRVALVQTDLAGSFDLGSLDLVVSNPPYIGTEEVTTLSPEIVDFEPHNALFAGEDGSIYLRRLLEELIGLETGAWLLLEIGAGQQPLLTEASAASAFDLTEIRRDYSGQPRIALLRRR